MENNMKHTPKFLRQRKFLVALPLLALPFLTLAFWAMGGGTVAQTNAQSNKGFNRDLPGVNLKEDKALDKMSYYAQAALDSAKWKELKKNDPYYKADTSSLAIDLDQERLGFNGGDFTSSGNRTNQNYKGAAFNDPNEQKVYQKLNQLNAALAQNQEDETSSSGQPYKAQQRISNESSGDVERLEKMMQSMQGGNSADPEMEQLNGMLEKIVDIQNPGLAQEKLRKISEQKRGRVFAVSTGKKEEMISSLDKEPKGFGYEDTALKFSKQQNGFFSFDEAPIASEQQNAIDAVVHETQTVVNGATVKLRLAADIFINGQLIPKDNFIYGIAALNGERLTIKINNVRYRNNLFPVELAVFDMDGLDGINIPGAINREVAKESADRGMQNLGFASLDPSVGMQAAGVGLEAAKSLFSKKVKLVRVTIKAGYQVLLRDEKQKQQN